MAGVQGCGAARLELWAAGQCQRVSFGGGWSVTSPLHRAPKAETLAHAIHLRSPSGVLFLSP